MSNFNIWDWVHNFPDNFKWGTASSAYQIEGGYNIDGKGISIWDTFANTPGKTSHNDNGNVSCDHYHRFREDIELMHRLGVNCYRFSIAWSRIFPDGRPDHINPPGVKFYDDIVDCCHQFDIEPVITLFHWDLPKPLEDQGGWFNPQTISYFESYAAWVSEHFSDRVTYFCTINEPQIISNLGYYLGLHAPGKQLGKERTISLLHQLALAHSKAVTAMRKTSQQSIKIGFASTGKLCYPKHNLPGDVDCGAVSASDIDAARTATFTTDEDSWMFCHQIFCDAVILGKSPDFSDIEVTPWNDCDQLCPPIDFLGLNVYNGNEIAADSSGKPKLMPHYTGFPRTALKWPVTPEVMNYGLRFIYERYHLPIFICENGLSCNDVISLDGKVHDPNRIDFLTRYMIELGNAIKSGVDIRGYMHWSFSDNFEWHSGYDERFGLVYIDYPSQKRIPKDSFYWYKDVIEEYNRSR